MSFGLSIEFCLGLNPWLWCDWVAWQWWWMVERERRRVRETEMEERDVR